MKIGLDFDNTIVNYDKIFYDVAVEWGVVTKDTPINKLAVRNLLRDLGKEDRWTEMQGYVYGARMEEAQLYPGVMDFIQQAKNIGCTVVIISHKTAHPFLGPKYDLHAVARKWIEKNIGLDAESIFFELTKEKKWERIAELGCDVFIDDLPEIIFSPNFPKKTSAILFDPCCMNRSFSAQNSQVRVASSWPEIQRELGLSWELETQVAELLFQAGLSQEGLSMERCAGGGNNRTFRVETREGVFAAKKYFSHSADIRDRLGAEFSFLTYAAAVAKELVPKPYAKNSEHKLALYEFIEGQPLAASEITEVEVNEAITFFCLLNTPAARMRAAQLGNASEACFSIQEHFNLIDARIKQILQIPVDTEEMQAAHHYAEKLNAFWLHLLDQTKEMARKGDFNLSCPLEFGQRCISPSDFGFHNALRGSDRRLRFLDFEYAGWDDPGKMAGDFFAQIAVPVPEQFFELFIQKTMALFPGPENLIRRAKILRPAYQVKWCCIALNVFLPHHLARRRFADENMDVASLQRAQLAKVKCLMQLLEDTYGL